MARKNADEMKEDLKCTVKRRLDEYLESNHLRKTSERYAILDAVYSMKGIFSIVDLDKMLLANHFRVSRATLYNNIKLFWRLRLVLIHHLVNGVAYEAAYGHSMFVHQVCMNCGKVTDTPMNDVEMQLNKVKLNKFRKEVAVLYVYGLCSSCQKKLARRKNMETTKHSTI